MKRSILLGMVLALVGVWAPTGPAQATIGDLDCNISVAATFSPPLFPGGTSTVNLPGVLTNCVSLNGNFPNLHSAAYSGTATATAAPGLNPCSLIVTIHGTVRLDWQNGQVSTGPVTLNTNPANGAIEISIYYDDPADPLYGTTAMGFLVVNPNLDCLFVGLTSMTTTAGLYHVS